MATYAGVRVEGLRETVRALEAFGVDVADLKDAMAEISTEGARLASGFAPRDTGRLAGTIRGNRAKAKAVITAGRASVAYAGVQNYGWPIRGIRATEFMQRADRELATRAPELLEASLDKLVRKTGLT